MDHYHSRSSGTVGLYPSLKVVNGNPAISYYDQTNGDLKFVRAFDPDGANWGIPTTVDSTGQVGYYTSMAVINGNPAITYLDNTNNDLRYVRALNASGTSWGTPLTLDSAGAVGQYTSLAIVNGNPAVSYQDETNANLKYIRASDSSGTSWGTSLTLDSSGNVGRDNSLAVVNGNPAISYHDATNGDLKFTRALDANGTSWGTPIAADSVGDVGSSGSLTTVSGKPAISYYANDGSLRFVRASDVSGTTWGKSIVLANLGNVGQYTSLAVVNGLPAVSCYDVAHGDLKYVRALDATGSSWGEPVIVDNHMDSPDDVGLASSQRVVSGLPAVSYHDNNNGLLKYVRATDAAGGNWISPLTVDTVGTSNIETATSLAIVNGNPAIAYTRFNGATDADLRYVRANNTTGTSWAAPVVLQTAGDVGYYPSLAVINGAPCVSFYDEYQRKTSLYTGDGRQRQRLEYKRPGFDGRGGPVHVTGTGKWKPGDQLLRHHQRQSEIR